MNHTFDTVGFSDIKHQLADYASTAQAKELALALTPYLSETELQRHLRETSQARRCLEELGTPPLPHMENADGGGNRNRRYVSAGVQPDEILSKIRYEKKDCARLLQ